LHQLPPEVQQSKEVGEFVAALQDELAILN